jgi:hypothetical protein
VTDWASGGGCRCTTRSQFETTRVDQHTAAVRFEQVLRAGDGFGAWKELVC